MTDTELLVVGGGPVGLVAALEARRAGLDVTVLEPREAPIDKACGEGLMPGALPLLGRLGIAPHGMALRGVRYTDGARSVEHRFTGAVGLGVRRTVLQAALAARAAEAGVRTVATRVDAVTQSADEVAAGGLRARWLIGADGLHSTVARSVGLAIPASRRRRRRRYGLSRHVRLEPWSELIEVHWTPLGELYVTPVDDRLVGLAVLAPQGVQFDDVLAAAPEVASRVAGADVVGDTRGAGPFRQRTRARVAGRVLLAGDASGYVDAITGEGLRLGFAQAAAAVSWLVDDDPLGYEDDWRRITRDVRRLTGGLVAAASSPLRAAIVPTAVRLPRVFGAAVDALAR